jgi:formylglycine-generating enzyme required for sulfatase activity
LSYQWQHNGTNLLENGRITGASSNVLQVANAQPEDAGDYTLVVSNSGGVTTSQVAALVVEVPGSAPPNPDPANLVWIAPGSFSMGSSTNEALRNSDEVQHSVTITRGFWMQKYLVTQQDYLDAVGSNPSHFTTANGFPGPLTRPVEMVSWDDATNYCALHTRAARAAGLISTNEAYRLPTEAEWEYACRAGTATAFYLGDRLLSGDANFNGKLEYDAHFGLSQNPEGSNPGQPTSVGSYAPNGWGLYDMIGNVWEWCQDWYGPYLDQSVIDPQGPASGTMRVVRGGSCGASPILCRSAQRRAIDPANNANSNIGFRVVLSAAAP